MQRIASFARLVRPHKHSFDILHHTLCIKTSQVGTQAPTVRTAAATAGKAFISISCGSVQGLLLPPLFDAMEVKRNWQTKVGALQLLEGWSKSAPVEVALSLPEIIPVASGCLADAKPQVHIYADFWAAIGSYIENKSKTAL